MFVFFGADHVRRTWYDNPQSELMTFHSGAMCNPGVCKVSECVDVAWQVSW